MSEPLLVPDTDKKAWNLDFDTPPIAYIDSELASIPQQIALPWYASNQFVPAAVVKWTGWQQEGLVG